MTFQRPHTWLFSVRGKEAGRLSGLSSVSRAVSRLNRLLVVSSAAQCVNYRAESLAMRTESRERGPALLTCTNEEGGTSCRRKNWGDDLFRREKPLFCTCARPGGDSVWAYLLVKFPVSTVQPNNTVSGEVWQRNTTFFHSSFVGKSRACCSRRVVRLPRARLDGDCNCWCNSL